MDFDHDLVHELKRAHAAHTIILYGSRARGDFTPESDIDVAAYADVETTLRDARLWNGLYLDGFVYPTAQVASPGPELLKLCGGRVLLDERSLAGPLLARLGALALEPVAPLREDERRMRTVWAQKTLGRIQRGDAEADYRRHWLLYEQLHDYFALRGLRYPGPKLALAELERSSPQTFALFCRAMKPAAPLEALAALVAHVGDLD